MPLRPTRSQAYPLFIILLPILFTLIVIIGYSEAKQQYYAAGIRNLDKQMNTITRLITLYQEQLKENHLSVAEAQNKIKELLSGPLRADGTRDLSRSDLTLGVDDYLLILDSKGNMIMHPQLEGKNLYNYRNSEGRFIFQEIIGKPRNILVYDWQNPTDSSPRTQISVMQYFPAWDWYIGISTYEDNFYNLFSKVKYLLSFLVIGSYIITVILFYLARRKERALKHSTIVSEQLAQTNQSILMTLAVALEERDAYTSGHSQRVAHYMRIIASQIGFSPDMLEAIYTGGLLHDIGKIGIEDRILRKQSRLTDEEYTIIKTHPLRGEALLRKLYADVSKQYLPKIDSILTITRSHHERYDGFGYPDRLKGQDIPLIARIAAVADSFDAMTSNRAYRNGMSFSTACDEISKHSGTQFCPTVVQAFFQSITEEVFYHAHQITPPDELLFDKIEKSSLEQEMAKPIASHL